MHFTVAVITESPEQLEKLLAPYQENNMGDCPKEFLKFFDMEEENKDEYENGKIEKIKLSDGSLISTWEYKGDSANVPLVKIPFKELYPSFEDYIKDWCGYTQKNEETGKYGYWENPNAQWDWYQVGGRWNDLLELKDGKTVNTAQFKDIEFPSDFVTFAVITPDGKWHSKDGEVTYHERFIVAANPDHYITIVDCHI